MGKARTDSLWVRLGRKDPSGELRAEVMHRLINGGEGVEEMAEWLNNGGVAASKTAIYDMLATQTLGWKLDIATLAAAEVPDLMDDPQQQAKKALARQMFALSYERLTAKEVALLNREIREDAKVHLAFFEAQTQSADFVLQVLREHGRLEELQSVAKTPGLSDREIVERLRIAVYGASAVAAPVAEGDSRGGAEAQRGKGAAA